ncbi:MAG TPA: hypothetical protein VKV21_00200 [Solirubrobacteraceae bacterium]|nr:hypothetical protein [Solirubrobacteraceae bacterium]
MPAAKRSSSSTAKSKRAPKTAARPAAAETSKPASRRRTAAKASAPRAKGAADTAGKSAAPEAKATATTARKSAGRTRTQAKSGATRTATAAKAGARGTAGAAKAGARGTGTAAVAGTRKTAARGKATATRARRTGLGREQITLTRARVQEVLDDAASRGRISPRDAAELVAEIMRRGRHPGDEVAELVHKGRAQLESATRRVRKVEPVDRLVRSADRARRAAGVGPSFPITGYDDLNVAQVQARIKELTRPELRKVLSYERKHANRKSVVGALERSLS